jgi:UPF0271 protein
MKVDLNSDMGEGFGPWRMGDDAALLDVITSANIACGFHAGDPDVMAETMRLAAKNGVGIGAHPGFADLKGFGRRRLNIGADELSNMIAYQLGAAEGVAKSVGAKIRHFKLHGALANMCAEDATLAKTCYSAALRVNPEIILMVLAETAQQAVVQELGANWAGEIFADRAYEDDATLVDRSKAGAVLHDADMAAERILNMLREDAIIAESGKRIPAPIDTHCLHGDPPEAVEMARALRTKLSAAGVTLTQF